MKHEFEFMFSTTAFGEKRNIYKCRRCQLVHSLGWERDGKAWKDGPPMLTLVARFGDDCFFRSRPSADHPQATECRPEPAEQPDLSQPIEREELTDDEIEELAD